MIDTHCHLTFPSLYERVRDVIRDAAAVGVDRMITVSTGLQDAQRCVDLAGEHPNVFATVGVHPHEAGRCTDPGAITAIYDALADNPGVVALGEMGLDWHYTDPPRADQLKLLDVQLGIVGRTDLPIVIHNREATDDLLPILRASGIPGERFVFHCFTGTDAELDAILAFGAMVSFTGIVTFSSARDLSAAAARVPLDRIMIETDAPYLTPEPHRKVRPNEPRYVVHVAHHLASARGMDQGEFTTTVDGNANGFFRLTG